MDDDHHSQMDVDKPSEESLEPSSSGEIMPSQSLSEAIETKLEGVIPMFDSVLCSSTAAPESQRGSLATLLTLLSTLKIPEIGDNLIPIPGYQAAETLVEVMEEEERSTYIRWYRERAWSKILNDKRMRKKKGRALRETQQSIELQAHQLHAMFGQTFKGHAVDELVKGIQAFDTIYDPKKYFGRAISIIQSSGAGKSRLVYELRKRLPSLSVCFRKTAEPRQGWPLGDGPVTRFFQDNSAYMGEELSAAFLGALFQTIAVKWNLLEWPKHGTLSLEDWMTDWDYEGVDDAASTTRHQSFCEVTTLASMQLRMHMQTIKDLRAKYINKEKEVRVVAWHLALFELFCHAGIQNLASFLSAKGQKTFILSLDECTELGSELIAAASREVQSGISLIAFQRILKAGDHFSPCDVRIWYLLLDTNSSISDLYARGDNAPSSRLATELVPLPPWPYIGFDQMVSTLGPIGNAMDVNYIQRLKYYGRPYWFGFPNSEVISAAQKKLFCHGKFTSFAPGEENHVLAAFASRIVLELGEGEAASRLAIDGVQKHMRILVGLQDQFVDTRVPSEPALAIASAVSLNFSPAAYESAVKTLLEKLILRNIVLDRGLQGELFSRLLLTIARDHSAKGNFLLEHRDRGPYVAPIRLSTFLQTLLGPDLGIPDGDDSKKPQVELREKLLAYANDCYVNFTHISQLQDNFNDLTLGFLQEAWETGTAFQCAFGQPIIEGLIVAYRGDLNLPFDVSNLLTVSWQTKIKDVAADQALVRQLASPFISQPGPGLARRRPCHVAIFMDLASDARIHDTKSHCQIFHEFPRPKQPIAKTGAWAKSPADTEAKRFCVNVRGHSASVYPVLSNFRSEFEILFQRMTVAVREELLPMASTFLQDIDRSLKFSR